MGISESIMTVNVLCDPVKQNGPLWHPLLSSLHCENGLSCRIGLFMLFFRGDFGLSIFPPPSSSGAARSGLCLFLFLKEEWISALGKQKWSSEYDESGLIFTQTLESLIERFYFHLRLIPLRCNKFWCGQSSLKLCSHTHIHTHRQTRTHTHIHTHYVHTDIIRVSAWPFQ